MHQEGGSKLKRMDGLEPIDPRFTVRSAAPHLGATCEFC
jgi:hypothetical protein